VIDLSGLPLPEVESERLLAEAARHPLDLARGPLVRAVLLHLAAGPPERNLALLTQHHIAADGWSMGVLLGELAALYRAFAAGRPSPLPELPVQYADYAVWQRAWMESGALAPQLAWWRDHLAGAPPALELPTDRPRPLVQSFRGGKRPVRLSGGLTQDLQTLGRRHGTTLYMTLLAVFQVLLARWSGQDELLVGSPVAGRGRSELEPLIGCFVNDLVLRGDLTEDPSFAGLLARVRTTALGAYAHQEVPFERLVEELRPERSRARLPLFQVVFVLQNAPLPALDLPGLTLTPFEIETGTAKFELTLSLRERGERMEGWLESSADLFDSTTAERLANGFVRLVAAASREPAARLSTLPLLAAGEYAQLLGEWNDTATPFPRAATVHGLFEQQAAQTPERSALRFAGTIWTYGELEARANRLAHHLQALGVAPEARVGLCLERSPELVAAILGILKVGGAYVPLDPAYPRERLELMLADSGAGVLVTAERFLPVLPVRTAAAVVLLDADAGSIARRPTDRPLQPDGGRAQGLAYVMYTSGSTGRPKGVAVPHRAIVRLVRETGYARFADDEVFLQLAPTTFDASTFEIWGALLNGALLAIFPPGTPSLAELGQIVERDGVTVLWLTAGLFHQMVEGPLAGLRGLRQLLAGGDALSVPHVRRALAELAGCRLINGYGPTENTTFTCCHTVTAATLGRSVPLGRPIANTAVYVLDRALQPVPGGVPGELYAGGDGLARGYAGDPALTAARFVPDPFGGCSGARLYRTGDRMRWRPDGLLEFLGRTDTQVKLRGYRVESAEIEAVLAAHPAVAAAAVLVQETAGDRRLVAYAAPHGTAGLAPPSAGELRAFLQGKLPAYMVPSVFIVLAALPLTANGKVDRRALAQIAAPPGSADGATAIPRTPVEELLAGLWAELLDVPVVGVDDDFFALGGHSLLAVRLAAQVSRVCGVEIPLQALFASPTVRALAAAVESARRREPGAAIEPPPPPLVPVPRDRELPLSFSQERIWFLDRLEPGSPAYNIAVAVDFAGELDPGVLRRSMSVIVRRHEALRTVFAARAGSPVQTVAAPSPLALPMVDLSGLEERSREGARLARAEARRAFDLARGPLLRMTLLRFGPARWTALLSLHHIAADGGSMEVLLGELAALYRAFSAGGDPPLPEPAIQYADYAVWQRARLAGEALTRQLAAWRARLAGAPEGLDLPTDRPRPAVQSLPGGQLPVALAPDLSRALTAFSRRHGATPFMTLLAAFQGLLGRLSDQEDVLVGSPVANRGQAEIEGLVGCFVNTLVLRGDLAGAPNFAELLVRTREVCLEAYAHPDLPFERLVEELRPQRDLSRPPLFQALLAHRSAPAGAAPGREIPGLRLTARPVPTGTSKFDLTLSLAEESGGELGGYLEYAAALFDEVTVARLSQRFERLLAGALAEPAVRLAELPWLADVERHQLLREWGQTENDLSADLCVHELLAAQAAQTPEATALVTATAEGRLTYRELHDRAEDLARRLRDLGVGPETRVAVCLPRTAELVVALLAVLKAGGAYVPLDPAYPEERRRYMLEDSGAAVWIGEGGAAAWGSPGTGLGDSRPSPDNLAYLIYTSGSTGRPKGVAITHRSAVALLHWARAVFSPAELRGVFAATSICFDLSVFELFAPLAWGGRIVLGENALSLPDHPAASEVTLLNTVPSAAAELVRSGGIPGSVRTVNLAGEPLPRALAAAIHAGGVLRVLNLYGPSEDTTYSTFTAVASGADREPTIGRPIAGSRARVLDRGGQPVPPGIPGELCLGGAGLARGYLGRPALTAERFVPDSWSGAGARLYRTGDRVRYRPTGELEFLGRIDHQVKVRGFRIEPGEIEAALDGHPAVARSAIVAGDARDAGGPGDHRLVAFVVPAGEMPPAAELRGWLEKRLPEFMLPAAWVPLPALPLTPNGKVDRKALARIGIPAGEPRVAATGTLPRTPTEELLAAFWAQILAREQVGVEDDFFDLGGHSLLATRVISRVREAFGVELPVRALFEARSIASLAVRIERERSSAPSAPPLLARGRGGELPLSFAQERLWFLDQLDPGSPVYNVPFALRLDGPLRVPALRAALAEIVRRHEVLRTTFALSPESARPMQVIAAGAPATLPAIDLAAVPEALGGAEAERLARAEARRPFDLARGPLYRFQLIELDRAVPERRLLLINLHHTVSDGGSIGVFLRELAAFSGAGAAAGGPPSPALPVQYADYALWQRAWLGTPGVLESQLAWWRERLDGAPARLDLPLDQRRPTVQGFRGDQVELGLPESLVLELRALSRRQGTTLFMTLLAGFHALLGRLAGQDDVLVGSPVANRTHREIEGLIGLFVNVLVLRGDLSGDPGLGELLAREREASLGAYDHQGLPFERLVEELRPERDLARSPLFQAMLVYQGTAPALVLPGCTAQVVPLANGTSKLELTLALVESGPGLLGVLEYNVDLFDRSTVLRLLACFDNLLAAAAAAPTCSVWELPLLAPEEIQQLVAWTAAPAASAAAGEPACLHQLFEAQVEQSPRAPALVHGERTLTYRELNRLADRLAGRLRALGVGPEERVGILLPRTPDMVVGLLGVLKAGGVYVPVDPAYPRQRQAFILEDAQRGTASPVLVTVRELLAGVPDFVGRALCLDAADEGEPAAHPPPASGVGPGNLAYLIYTSGSTGRPKGVAIEHASATAFVRWARQVFSVEELAVVLACTSICFDLSVFELFVPLAVGGKVVLAADALELPRLAARDEVTLINTVPSAIEELMRGGLPVAVRTVNLAGEPLERDLVRRVHGVPGVRRVFNLYGPSEATTYSTFTEVPPGAVPTIGRPVTGTRAQVLDRRLQPLPVGVPGELCLGGAGLARGYLHHLALTAERFVPDPLGPPGSRLYRTGDLARRLPSGELEFLGRIDHQVKVRGFRIELGEIEATLGAHKAVARAVVLARDPAPGHGKGERALVAYVMPAGEAAPAAELRRFLAARLPDFMIPQAFVALATLPLTANGKVDRKALPAPDEARSSGRGFVAPRTPEEELLAGLWSELLGVEPVGVEDDFFALGGHSLLAARVAARVRSAWGVELPVRSLFTAPTVAGLAALIAAARQQAVGPAAPLLVSTPRSAEPPLSFAQERLWFLDRLEPGSGAFNIPVAVRLTGRFVAEVFERSLTGIVRRHEALRTTFGMAAGRPVQVINPAGRLTLPAIDLSALPEGPRSAAAERLAAAAATAPFDLARGPLLRGGLLRLGREEHVALLTLHHAVADGWSIGVLLGELTAFYGALVTGGEPALPELPIQYADYAAWQRDWLQGEALAHHLAWWRERLGGPEGAPAALALPTDRPRPAVGSMRGASLRVAYAGELSRALAALGRRHGATLFMTLLAAFQVLLARLSGEERLVVGAPVANRSRVETEGLIGFFLNTLPLAGDLGGDPSFPDFLGQVRETALGAYAHQDLPFEKLVTELAPERNLAHAPVFQVLFALQNVPLPAFELPGLTLEQVAVDSDSAKLDLVLNLTETDRGLAGRWLYKTDLFDRATAVRIAGHFRTLIEALAASPGRRLSELPLLSAAEEQQLREWNATATAYPGGVCLHELIAEQAACTPDAVAVSSAGESLSYRRLDHLANALAWRLRALGVGPEARVGIAAERSLQVVVGLLAILKAGGAYVPLDPAYPRERLAWLLADSRVSVLLTAEGLAETLPAHGARVLLLDGAAGGDAAAGERPPAGGAGPDNLAYVIYTSGSTGKPKGAMNTHRGIVNRLLWMQERYGLAPADRVLQKTPVSFDVSVWELFWPLLAGARLVLARPGHQGDSAYLVETIAAFGITTLHFVPSMLQVFAAAPGVERCGSLARVIASGEALPRDLQDRFLARSGASLHNLYGPTEAAVDVTYWACERGPRRTVPIGRPVANTAIHLLDRALRPVPVGVTGELFIGGVQVGRGYWQRPELTAERFVPDPFSPVPGARLYRTGDLARCAPDATVEYLGRLDHQVKIRGFRVELGEIEAALADLPGVREAVVLPLAAVPAGGAAGDRRLVAYVAPADLSPAALRAALLARLPEPMVPGAFLRLDRLPLSPNGKADRQALARLKPEPEAGGIGRGQAAPRTALERYLAGLWQEAVGAERAGIDDSFFALGGSSISGAILVNRLQEKLGEIVHVVAIFDHPTVAGFAAYLARDYPEAVARVWGAAALGERDAADAVHAAHAADTAAGRSSRVGDEQIALLRRIVTPVAWRPATPKNPPAVFVLSPPRSGSTLLRVMLAGHPRLFAPPELELLTFADMAARKAAFSGRDSFWLEGLLRAVMALRQCGPEEAAEILAVSEAEALPTQELCRRLQGWLGARLLVDKTPSYALDPALLRRLEETFEEPRYLHLVRHPYGMIRSFEEARLEQVFFRHRHPFSRRELAELVWLVSHDNVTRFLAGVPAGRWHRVRFEDLVRDPVSELAAICAFLGIDYHPDMAEPYQDRQARMTDGVHAESRMLGDVKFHRHGRVDAGVAERWREELTEDFLSAPARALAAALGFEAEPQVSAPIPRLPRRPGEPFPLSFVQERLWFLDQLDPGGAAYNIPAAFRLAGRLSVPALAASAVEMARRHETLRTTFAQRDGRPVQVVAPPLPVPLPLIDLTGLPAGARLTVAERLGRFETARPFDLVAGPLVRRTLLRLGSEEWVILLTLHHIVADGWSMGLFIRELASLYTAGVEGKPSPLPEPPVQYADYAAWQRGRLAGGRLESQLAWWREQLGGPETLSALELPTDRPRPPIQILRGGERSFALPPELSQRLRELSRREGATLFMTLLAAFQALLGRLAGQSRVLVGSPVANRTHREIEGLIGCFINTLVFAGDLTGDGAFRQLLARSRQATLGALAHAEVPFERLVEELRPPRDLSRPPLFQAMLAYQNVPFGGALALSGLAVCPLRAASGTSKLELTLAVAEAGEAESWHLAGGLEYSAELFDPTTMQRLLGQLAILLAAVAADPERPLGDLPLLSPAEHQQTALEWATGDGVGEGDDACLHELFEAQALRTPGAFALVAGAERLTYRELDRRAGRLARRLQALGAGPERPVGVCLHRSADLVVALLAVLKSGSAYVPLDPAYPVERLAFLVSDSAVTVLVARPELLTNLPGLGWEGPALSPVDEPGEESGGKGEEGTRGRPARPGNLAYLIYTSGSTGVPKGVAIEHRSAVALVCWALATFPPADLAGVLASTSIAFDLSIFELFAPLSCGGTVVLAEDALALPAAAAAARAAGVEITLVNTVPSAIAELVRVAALPASVRTVNLAGEPLQRPLADRIYGVLGVERVLNLYGPSEDTTYSTCGRVPRGTLEAPTIGRPVAGSEAYVLDERLGPAPAGVAGELYLGGRGLARGYLGRPERTAERFVPDPFGLPGARLYRTGDLARFRVDGELEFLGRRDFQVKLRGFRIELGEIEAALAAHPAVAEAAVLALPCGEDVRLVAFWVGEEGVEPRSWLRRRLPEHMVPSGCVRLETLPRTPNGKVDRRALSRLGTAGAERQTYVVPRTLTEELLAGIWAEVLKVERVGAHDNFFDLGGHSLLAAQVTSRVREAAQLELPVRSLFQYPTIEGLAIALEDLLFAEEKEDAPGS